MAVSIPIISEFDSKGIKSAINEFKSLEGAGAKAQFALKKAAIPAAAAIGGLAVVIGDATKAAIEDAKAQALLAQAITNNTLAGEANIKVAEAFIESTMMSAAVADDELRPALASLVQVTGEMTSAQDGLTLALDVAAATGVDLGTATDAIAKAYGGNTKALGTLLPSVRSLIKEGASLDEVFAAVAGTVGGSAAVAANSAEGQMKKLSLTIGETKEALGAAFLPILERVLPTLQRFATYLKDNTQIIIGAIAVVGSLSAAILALNFVMNANPFTLVATALNLLVVGFVAAWTKSETFRNVFSKVANAVIGYMNGILNTWEFVINGIISGINLVIRGINLIKPGSDISFIPELSIGNIPMLKPGGGGGGPTEAAGPDRVERMIQVPSIPAIAPVTLPAPSGGGGGGGRGGGGGQMTVQPFDPSVYDPKSRYYEVPAMLDAAYAPKQAVYNVTVNSTIADERLGDTIVNALKQYNRRSGPLDVQIA
jgi:hypothetical protein